MALRRMTYIEDNQVKQIYEELDFVPHPKKLGLKEAKGKKS